MKMAESKYGKYIMKEPQAKQWPGIPISVDSSLFSTIGCDFAFVGVTKPTVSEHPPHKHDVDEFLFFVGGNPENMLDFGGEVELSLGWGEDQEKHTITSTSIVYIPKGLVHLPMNFKRVDRPLFCGHLLMNGTYTETQMV
jgi:mannose-6-phosphate isomerase-like protein (cupin superfamily)